MTADFNYEDYLLFNPEGKIKQLEYIRRTPELGNTCLALCNKGAGVILTHVPPKSRLAEPQQKIFPISKHAVFTFSGITNDGVAIVNYLKDSALKEDVLKDRPIHYLEVFRDFSFDAALRTLTGTSRMYGAEGLLMLEQDGIKLVQVEPTGIITECVGGAVGNRAQSCKSVLEDECENFKEAAVEELVHIGMKSLRNAYPDSDADSWNPEDIHVAVLEAGRELRITTASEYL